MMKIAKRISELDALLSIYRGEGKSIGFVPTMGALHEGHATLIKRSVEEMDVTVVSIFVNPTQFNNKIDLQLYPRTLEADSVLLESIGVDVVFSPTEEEIYPEPDNRQFDFGMLDKVMEGAFRPGHFNGVAQVVSRLFEIVKPDKSFFGEKDFQQLAIVRRMVADLNSSVEIDGVPIVREKSGLAMSSRNERLTPEQRANAAAIYKVLSWSKSDFDKMSVDETIKSVVADINSVDDLKVEYFDIVDGNSLQSVSSFDNSDYIVGCIAVFCGDVRLIDNIRYK